MRFVADRMLNPGAPKAFYTEEDAKRDPFAVACFAIDGVAGLMVTNDFCDIQKTPAAQWDQLLPNLEEAIRVHFAPKTTKPIDDETPSTTNTPPEI